MSEQSVFLSKRFLHFAMALTVLLGVALPQAPAFAINGAQKGENRVSRDRWLRSEAKPASKESSENEDDEPEVASTDDPRHVGELNGKLRMKAW